MMRRALRHSLLLLAALAGCHPGAALVDEPATAADALARRDGPLALDAAGHWLPVLAAQARFTGVPRAALRLQALDVGPDGAAIALQHDGAVLLGEQSIASGRGVVVVRLEATGQLRWKAELPGETVDVSTLRLSSDGAVVAAGHLDQTSYVMVGDAASGTLRRRVLLDPKAGRLATMDSLESRVVIAGELPGPRPGVEPWQGFVEGVLGDVTGSRQIFGSDQPIHMTGLDASVDGWVFVVGSFAGTFAAGGRPAIGSALRTPFVAAVAENGHVAWLAPIFAPTREATMEPVAVHVDDGIIHLGLAVAAPDGSSSLIEARLDGDGSVLGSCELARSTRSVQVRTMAISAELTALLGRFDGALSASGQPVARYHVPTAALLFFGAGCKLVGRLEPKPGEELVAVRPLGEQIVVGVEAGAAVELRWYNK